MDTLATEILFSTGARHQSQPSARPPPGTDSAWFFFSRFSSPLVFLLLNRVYCQGFFGFFILSVVRRFLLVFSVLCSSTRARLPSAWSLIPAPTCSRIGPLHSLDQERRRPVLQPHAWTRLGTVCTVKAAIVLPDEAGNRHGEDFFPW